MSPEIVRVPRGRAAEARGIVIVIDVIRAFTVAAYAIAGGARRLWLVRAVAEAFELRRMVPDALLAGEVGGRLIPGFDLNNSPVAMRAADVRGRLIVQRTGSGTQGAVGALHADHLLVCSLTNARATATRARELWAQRCRPITLMPTGTSDEEEAPEDDACADYLEALLCRPDHAPTVLARGLDRIRLSGRLDAFAAGDPDLPMEDIPAFLDVDRFAYAMAGVRREQGGIRCVDVARHDAAIGL
jgi:2-phosphosulfolactate phosphatase